MNTTIYNIVTPPPLTWSCVGSTARIALALRRRFVKRDLFKYDFECTTFNFCSFFTIRFEYLCGHILQYIPHILICGHILQSVHKDSNRCPHNAICSHIFLICGHVFDSVATYSNISIFSHRFESIPTDFKLWPQIRISGHIVVSVGTY